MSRANSDQEGFAERLDLLAKTIGQGNLLGFIIQFLSWFWMYLRSSNLYKSRQRDQVSDLSQNSNEKSITNTYHLLELIVEEEALLYSTSSMSLDAYATKVPKYSMAFHMRLGFVKVNSHNAQLFKDLMNQWVVKIEDNPVTFEVSPWVNYQGDLYMGQG